jgi:Major tropism determinant N-terminal domain
MSTKIQIRRGLAATWLSSNPILSSGELGLETDTNKVKIGDGSTVWNSLEYFYDQTALSQSSASATYLTQAAYASASPNFATDSELASAIVTASAAAVAYADALTTADVAENTNLYFTNERAVNAGSATYILQTSQQGIINSASAAAVTAVLDGAPGALDTLNELAAALNDDSSFATTVTNSLSTKLDLSTASATYLTQSNASTLYSLPSQSENTGRFLSTTGSAAFWQLLEFPSPGNDIILSDIEPLAEVEGDAWFKNTTGQLYVSDGNFSWLEIGYLTQSSASTLYSLPSQSGNTGKYLTTNGTTTSWATVEGGGGGTASDDTIFKAQLFFGGSN